MYKDKKIIFKQVNEQKIEILLQYEDFKEGGGFEKKEKVIGQIFSPSGSGNDTINAIQVCGFSEAFDYWGCGLFGKPMTIKKGSSKLHLFDHNRNRMMEQVRDIQLYFDEDTQRCSLDDLDDCHRCFNTPCTCEIKQETDLMNEKFGDTCPFKLKREHDIKELQKVKKEKVDKK